MLCFFFSSRRRHTRYWRDWSSDVCSSDLVSTYAEALFEAARERDELEGTLDDLRDFAAALEESEELKLFFYGGQVPEREKRRAIDALTQGMTFSTRNFLKVLADNGREEILEEVLLRYEDLVKEHLGRVEVEVTTAVELSEEERNWIMERLGRLLEGREVILDTSVDPDILGGAVFRFGGRMVDSSVRGQLLSLRDEMLERSVDRKSTRLNSSHANISYAVFCLKKKKTIY